MSLSRKHFQAIADIFKFQRKYIDTDAERRCIDNLIVDLADFCAGQNSNFDRGRFYAAADFKLEET